MPGSRFWLGSSYDRQQRVAQISQNVDQVGGTPMALFGKDAMAPGRSTAATELPPRAPTRARDYTFTDGSEFWLFGTDKFPPGQTTYDSRRPFAFLARQFRYPVYDANAANPILPLLAAVGLPPGQSTVATELPPRAAPRASDLRNFTDGSEFWLFGTDAMAKGEQSWELAPRRAPRLSDYTFVDGSEFWLFGTDAVNAGAQSYVLPPRAAPRVVDLVTYVDASENWLFGTDAMLVGQQSTSLPPIGALRARDYSFTPPINLPTLTTVVQQIPYGAQLTDSLPPRATPRLRDYTWSQDLIPDLIGQDAVNPGQQSFALPPSPAPQRARDYSITAAFPLELISQDAMAAGRQAFDLPPIAALRARDYSFVPPVNLSCLTTVVQQIPPGQQSTDSLPLRAAPRARDYTWVYPFPLVLNGQDAMVVGDQYTALAPRGPQRASTLTDPGINLTILITVVPLPAGQQSTELAPKAAQRLRDYTHVDQTRRQLVGQDALPNGQNADRSALPPKAPQRARDYTWLQSMQLYVFQQLPAGQSSGDTEGPPKGPLRLRDYTHLDVTKQNLIGQDSMVTGQSWLSTDNLPPRAYARLVDYTWFSRFSLPDLIAHTKPGTHVLTDRAMFVHTLTDSALHVHTVSDSQALQ